jgi:hypothetical protein
MSRDAYPTKRDLEAAIEKHQGWMGPTFRLPAVQPYVTRQEAVTAAVAAERERCAKIAEGHDGIYTDGAPVAIAEAIRAG